MCQHFLKTLFFASLIRICSAFSLSEVLSKVTSLYKTVKSKPDYGQVKITSIKRDWTWGSDYAADGEFDVSLFIPEDGEIKGCAFFMHGFSQYPIAYSETLKQASSASQVAIVAVETGVTDVLRESLSYPKAERKKKLNFLTQRALMKDTEQCIKMIMEDNTIFSDYGITKKDQVALIGHSMGGGLTFPLAAMVPSVEYLFAMAPAAGEFDPIIEGVEKRNPKSSMILSGTWDRIAKANIIKNISDAANEIDENSSSIVKVKRGLHTGFQSNIVIGDFKISSVVNFLNLSGVVTKVLNGVSYLRVRTGQLKGTEALMEYFLMCLVEGKSLSPGDAESYLKENTTPRVQKKFLF